MELTPYTYTRGDEIKARLLWFLMWLGGVVILLTPLVIIAWAINWRVAIVVELVVLVGA